MHSSETSVSQLPKSPSVLSYLLCVCYTAGVKTVDKDKSCSFWGGPWKINKSITTSMGLVETNSIFPLLHKESTGTVTVR
jgi:hypothetical protein